MNHLSLSWKSLHQSAPGHGFHYVAHWNPSLSYHRSVADLDEETVVMVEEHHHRHLQ